MVKKISLFFSFILLNFITFSQLKYAIKVGDCETIKFCDDCGEFPASYVEPYFKEMLSKMKLETISSNFEGKFNVQIIIKDNGTACVLSHSDTLRTTFSTIIINHLKRNQQLAPARDFGKNIGNSSISLYFGKENGEFIYGYNRTGQKTLKVRQLKKYDDQFTDYQKDILIFDIQKITQVRPVSNLRSLLMVGNELLIIDKNAVSILKEGILVTIYDELPDEQILFDFVNLNNSEVLISTNKGLYILNIQEKTIKSTSNLSFGFMVSKAAISKEVFVGGIGVVGVLEDNNWIYMTPSKMTFLPNTIIFYTYKDNDGNYWFSTAEGVIKMSNKGEITNFEMDEEHELYNRVIISITEDKKGNLYFASIEPSIINSEKEGDVGFVKLANNGTWTAYFNGESGIPSDINSKLKYNEFIDHIVINSPEAGLVIFDGENNFQLLFNQKQELFDSVLTDFEIDQKGTIYFLLENGELYSAKLRQ